MENKTGITGKLKSLALSISELERLLPYADGQVYKQDQRKISELKSEMALLLAEQRKINNAALLSLVKAASLSPAEAKAVVVAIAKGQVDNVTITY